MNLLIGMYAERHTRLDVRPETGVTRLTECR